MTAFCPLGGGHNLELADNLKGRLRCGVLVLSDVKVTSHQGAAQETKARAAGLIAKYKGLTPAAIPALADARTLYKSFGMDPSRHRPSCEALLRRILHGKDLFQINSAVDSCNLASLDFMLPVGMYDLSLIQGQVQVRVGGTGDSYAGIRKGPVNVGNRLALYDDLGPFGSPTSDSARTCVEDGTTAILAVIFSPAGYDESKMRENMGHFASLFSRYCSAVVVMQKCLGWRDES